MDKDKQNPEKPSLFQGFSSAESAFAGGTRARESDGPSAPPSGGPVPLAQALAPILAADIPAAGAIPFEEARLLPVASRNRLPPGAATVFSALFPYYAPAARGGNLSMYCSVADYHAVAGAMLARACQNLARVYPGRAFVPFVDASPIDEVDAAAKAGLGVKGQNGLLITPRWGSWVFLGDIVTDLPVECAAGPVRPCLSCGLCRKACPGRALSPAGLEPGRCASALGQKKGALTPEEEAIVAAAGLCFGCDICQEVCPMNRRAEPGLPPFQQNIVNTLSRERLAGKDWRRGEADSFDRAFAWRGKEVLRRNLALLDGTEQEK